MKYGARNKLVGKVKSVKKSDVMSLVKFLEQQMTNDKWGHIGDEGRTFRGFTEKLF